jgi:septum formation protein
MNIILGSSSIFRQKAFTNVTPHFESMSPDIDEKAIRDTDPEKLTLALANAKADALVPKIATPSILVTADQVVVLGQTIREKPTSPEEARAFLRSYSEQPVRVVNGVAVVNTATGKRASGNDTVTITFKKIPDTLIEQFIAEGEIFKCAGALRGEHPALQPYVVSKEGTDDSLRGVPVELIQGLIQKVS